MFLGRAPALKQSLFSSTVFRVFRATETMSDKLEAVPPVEIDDSGVFKYILIKVYPKDPDAQGSKNIVRGFKRCEYHSDIYDETLAKLQKLSLDSECLGGGRIQHNPNEKKIHVYGYSQGFGRADHSVAVELLKQRYPEYVCTWGNDGY